MMSHMMSRHSLIYVVLCRTPGALGVLLPCYSCLSMAILGGHALDAVRSKHVILFANVMSLNNAVTSHVMSQHHTCIGHMTFYYKMPANTSVGVLACCSFICQVRLYHPRPACGWCLTCVGRDASGTSPYGSLLASTVIIVLAFVNSAVSPAGTLKYLNETQESCSTPC